jgi:hypothetical protein
MWPLMRTWRARWALGLALAFALVILATPAMHPASDCLSDSPEHCAACRANPPATSLEPDLVLGGPDRVEAERVELAPEVCPEALLPAEAPGRAPPA